MLRVRVVRGRAEVSEKLKPDRETHCVIPAVRRILKQHHRPQQEDTDCSIQIGHSFCEWLLNLVLGFPAEVTAVTWLLRPETKGYQETLETLLQSK